MRAHSIYTEPHKCYLHTSASSLVIDLSSNHAAMPTAFREGPYRFHFYSSDCNEPMHVHVQRDRNEAKFWLDPIEIAYNYGFAGHELRKIRKMIRAQKSMIADAWYEHCGHN